MNALSIGSAIRPAFLYGSGANFPPGFLIRVKGYRDDYTAWSRCPKVFWDLLCDTGQSSQDEKKAADLKPEAFPGL